MYNKSIMDGQTISVQVVQPEGESRPERRDAVENRERILAAAERLFAEQGVAAVSMAEIAQSAGVGKGTLYRRFCNKGDLCLALMDSQMRAFQNERLREMREMTVAGVPYLAQLERFLEALVYFTRIHAPLLREVQQHSTALDEEEVERPHFWQYMTVHGLLQRAVAAGETAADLDTAYLAEALLAPLEANTLRFQMENLNFSAERIAAGLQSLVTGIRRTPTETA